MYGNVGTTAAKFDANIRALRGTVMGLPSVNATTESDYYVGMPTAANAIPTGVLGQDVVEPGYPLTSEMWLDPNTGNPINGSVPPAPFISGGAVGIGKAWELHRGNGQEVEVIAADTTITQDCVLVIADAYGRVTNGTNFPGGTKLNQVGRAKYASTAVNQRIRMTLDLSTATA
jgi:hypothetical protein